MTTATLTDVKNKTGDVFALADKYGSVIITSYNKPKYVLSLYNEKNPQEVANLPEVKIESVADKKHSEEAVKQHEQKPSTPASSQWWDRRSHKEKEWTAQVKQLFKN